MSSVDSTKEALIRSRLRWALLWLALLVSLSTAGYMLVEGWSFFDALYMTIITLTTVGYGETHPLSAAGRVFSMGVMVIGIGGVLYTMTAVMAYTLEVQFPQMVRRRRVKEKIAKLSNHYLVCGVGRVGQHVAETLKRENAPFVAIDNTEEAIRRCEAAGYAYVEGDATNDDILKAAGIERAKGLVTSLDTDEENLYVVLSARVLRPDLFIVARATSGSAETKLKMVGADRVLTPYSLAGRRMATLLIRPVVSDFLDTVTHSQGLELLIEELAVAESSALAGRTLSDLSVRTRTGAIILAIRRRNGVMVSTPAGATSLEAGDQLVVLGTRSQLRDLEGLR